MPSELPSAPNFFCSQYSAGMGEPLAATATRADVYLLVEYHHGWGAKAYEESSLPTPLKAHLDEAVRRIPGARVLLVKQAVKRDRPQRFFAALVSEVDPRLYEFHFDTPDGLTSLDIPPLAACSPQFDAYLRPEPLFLICTNGKRDACCARFGLSVFTELAKAEPEAAWQTTHVGGHRFAGTGIFLPHGLFYGRLTPAVIARLAHAYRLGQLDLDHFRGRACYPEAVQAAEILGRQQANNQDIGAYRLQEARETAPGEWLVRFTLVQGGQEISIRLAKEITDTPVYTSCKPDKPGFLTRYHLG